MKKNWLLLCLAILVCLLLMSAPVGGTFALFTAKSAPATNIVKIADDLQSDKDKKGRNVNPDAEPTEKPDDESAGDLEAEPSGELTEEPTGESEAPLTENPKEQPKDEPDGQPTEEPVEEVPTDTDAESAE